jgi:hypothetical protein
MNSKPSSLFADVDRLQQHRVVAIVGDLDAKLQLMVDLHGALLSRHGHRRHRLEDSGPSSLT